MWRPTTLRLTALRLASAPPMLGTCFGSLAFVELTVFVRVEFLQHLLVELCAAATLAVMLSHVGAGLFPLFTFELTVTVGVKLLEQLFAHLAARSATLSAALFTRFGEKWSGFL